MRFGLRAQVVASLLILVGATVFLVAIITLSLSQRFMIDQALKNAQDVAELASRTMAASVDESLPLHDPRNAANLDRLCELFSEQFEGTRLLVVDADLEIVAAWPHGRRSPPDVELAVVRHAREPIGRVRTIDELRQIDVFAPLEVGGEVVAAILLERPLYEVDQLIAANQQLGLLYIGLDALLIMAFGYLVLTRAVVRPIARIAAASERVAAGVDPTPIGVGGPLEIANLVRSLNSMLARLAERREQLEQKVNELAQANRRLEDAQQEVIRSDRLATIGQLAAGIAHEVGNPLSAITGLLELLDDPRVIVSEDDRDALHRAQREVARIHRIIRELLDYARRDAGRVEPIDLRSPVQQAIALCGHHARGRRLQVQVEGPVDLPLACVDEHALVQVMLNLLLNAADATSGDGRVVVTMAISREIPDEIEVRVADDGPGIEPRHRARIFDPFFTTKPPGSGTGLGLAICERIVSGWGGRLSLDESVERGATFVLSLPVAQSARPSGK